jgi:hypothetical protein
MKNKIFDKSFLQNIFIASGHTSTPSLTGLYTNKGWFVTFQASGNWRQASGMGRRA